MAINFGPKIATEGLMLCLDPMNNKSYPFYTLPVKKGLNLWLDAADSGTFTTYGVQNNVIAQWRDKSDYGNHASGRGNPIVSGSLNGNGTVYFSGSSNYFVNDTLVIPNEQQSIFAVYRGRTVTLPYSEIIFSAGSGGDNRSVVGSTSANLYISLIGDGTIWTQAAAANTPNYSTLNQTSILTSVNSGTTGTPYYSGITQTNKTGAGVGYTGYTLGALGTTPTLQPPSGQLGEILVYNRKLDTKEIQKVHTYLGQKWGVTNYDRSLFNMGSHPTTDSIQSGNSIVYNPTGFFRFPGTGLVSNTLLQTNTAQGVVSGQAGTVCLFVRPIGTPTTINYLYYSISADSQVFSIAMRTNNRFATFWGVDQAELTSNVVPNNTWVGLAVSWKRGGTGNQSLYQSGILIATGNYLPGSANPTVSRVGGSSNGLTNFSGDIGLINIYNRELTSGEIYQNYLAMKSRYGL